MGFPENPYLTLNEMEAELVELETILQPWAKVANMLQVNDPPPKQVIVPSYSATSVSRSCPSVSSSLPITPRIRYSVADHDTRSSSGSDSSGSDSDDQSQVARELEECLRVLAEPGVQRLHERIRELEERLCQAQTESAAAHDRNKGRQALTVFTC